MSVAPKVGDDLLESLSVKFFFQSAHFGHEFGYILKVGVVKIITPIGWPFILHPPLDLS
jgi:hypothetical protein